MAVRVRVRVDVDEAAMPVQRTLSAHAGRAFSPCFATIEG
jgi:hypothetical protein